MEKDEIIINDTATPTAIPTEVEANSASATSADQARASADAKAAATVTINVVNGKGDKATPVVIPSDQTASGEAIYDRTGYTDANPAKAGERKDKMNSSDKTPWWGWLLWAILGIAVLAIVIFAFRGCDGDGEFRLLGTVPAETTDPEQTATTATASSDDGKETTATASSDDKKETTVNVNIYNNNDVDVNTNSGASAASDATQAESVYGDASATSDSNSGVWLSNDEYQKLLANSKQDHTCPEADHSECKDRLSEKDEKIKELEKEISAIEADRDYWKNLYQNHTCPTTTSTSSSHVCDHTQCRADLDWAKEQWAADVEERDEEIADLKQKNSSLERENSNLKSKNSDLEEKNTNLTKENKKLQNKIDNYSCPCCGCGFDCTCGGSCHPSGGCDGSCDCGGSFGNWSNGNHNPSGSNGSTTGGSTGGSSTGNSNGVIWAEDPDEYAQTGQPDGAGTHNPHGHN